MRGFLVINPRAGTDSPTAEELAQAARERGIEPHLLREGEDAAELARNADADVLGAAGGDGSVATVAAVAVERDLPFVVVPYGTRNHFARDLGLDRDDPLGALEAFDGEERRVDVGRVGERRFDRESGTYVYDGQPLAHSGILSILNQKSARSPASACRRRRWCSRRWTSSA